MRPGAPGHRAKVEEYPAQRNADDLPFAYGPSCLRSPAKRASAPTLDPLLPGRGAAVAGPGRETPAAATSRRPGWSDATSVSGIRVARRSAGPQSRGDASIAG